MLGFTPFKRHANKFNYIPRYYDPEKEAREQRRAELRGERAEDGDGEYRPAQYIRTGEAYDDLWRKRVQEARAGGGAREKGSMPRISRRPGIWPLSWEKRSRVKKWG